MEADRLRWDERHRDHGLAGPLAPDLVRDHPELLDAIAPSGRALDLACGPGAVSLWLAGLGYDVISLDVSQVAVDLLVAAAREHRLADRIEARVHDADEGLPADVDGLALVVCQRFRDPALYAPLVGRLAAGGVMLLTVLSAVGLDQPPGPFHAPPGELVDAFTATGVEILYQAEGAGLASIAVRRVDPR